MAEDKLAFEDFEPGRRFILAARSVTAEEIIEFATEFDPQPMHLDEAAAKAGIFGSLAASGWHTSSLFMRMMCDGYLSRSTSQGSPGIDVMEWRKPVLAGDSLTGTSTVIERRAMRSRPGIGLVNFRHEVYNQRGELVCLAENAGMFSMRAAPGDAA